MIKSVLFDLGNVLVRFDPLRFFQVLGISDPARQQELKPKMLGLGRIYEAGGLSTEEFRSQFRNIFDNSYTDDTLLEAFLAVLPDPVEGSEDIVRRVSRKYEIALVSNTSPIHFDLCLRTIPALRHFDRFYLSYELRALKPDAAFYRRVEEGEGIAAAEMIFIDDLAENIDAANAAGFNGIQFTGAQSLERDLLQREVL